VSCFN